MTHSSWMGSALVVPAGPVTAGLVTAGFVTAGLVSVGLVTAGFGAVGVLAGAGARWLLGRLRRGARVRPPGCEVGVTALWGTTGAAWAADVVPAAWLPVLLGLGWLGIAAAAVDLAHHRLPDALTLPALPAVLLLLVPLGSGAVARGVIGAGIAVAAHAVLHLFAPEAMGAGDVKLAAPLGAVLAAAAWPALVLAAVLAALITGCIATVGRCTRRLARGAAVPHGPSMLIAAWIVVSAAAIAAAPG